MIPSCLATGPLSLTMTRADGQLKSKDQERIGRGGFERGWVLGSAVAVFVRHVPRKSFTLSRSWPCWAGTQSPPGQ